MSSQVSVYDQDAEIVKANEGKAGGLTYAEVVKIISGAQELPPSEETMASIMFQILSANSLEEGLGEREATGIKEYVGEKITIHDFRLNNSDEKYGKGVYAAIDSTTVDGERVIVTTGAGKVLSGLTLMLKLGQWDRQYLVKSKPGSNGDIYSIVLVPSVALDDGSTF